MPETNFVIFWTEIPKNFRIFGYAMSYYNDSLSNAIFYDIIVRIYYELSIQLCYHAITELVLIYSKSLEIFTSGRFALFNQWLESDLIPRFLVKVLILERLVKVPSRN